MKTLALVLASFCIIAQATSVFQAPTFLQLKQSPFGNSVGSLIEMNLETEDPKGKLNAINDLLNQVEESLEKQAESALEDITGKRNYCANQGATFEGQIAQVKSELADARNEQQNLQDEQSDKDAKLRSEQANLEKNKAELEKTHQQIDTENATYEARDGEYEEAIKACEDALTLLSKLQTSGATGFAQVKSRFNGIITLLQKHVAQKTSTLIQPVINILTELSSGAQEVDQAKLGKIINLINQLLEELRAQKIKNTSNHNQAIEELNFLVESLERSIAFGEAEVESLTTRLTAISKRLEELDVIISNLTDLLGSLESSLEALHNQCNEFETVYSSEKQERDQQQNLLDQLKEYFHSHVVPSVSDVRDESYEDVLTN